MKRIDLGGIWHLRWNDGERGERLERILAGDVEWDRGWEAIVPGSVHETLLEHGVIPEPNAGTNVLACRWVEETIWYYRREFAAPQPSKGERCWIIFECLDLAARIFLNGRELGSHRNAFYPCKVEATEALWEGVNELVVEVESGLFSAMHRSADGLGVKVNHQLTKMPWLRKAQSQHGWDWAPRLLNVGIPGSVSLEQTGVCRWDHMVVLADLSKDLKTGHVTARVFAENFGNEPCDVELTATVEGHVPQSLATSLAPGMNHLEINLEIHNPELWGPVGHGKQKRYEVTAALRTANETLGTACHKIGFRHVRVNQEAHPSGGRYFLVEINGKPVFCKGGNYVPQDLILSRVDRNRHSQLIDLALEANCNFLRVWGGGVYESDDFYDLCDEKGILVWQDFVFACCKYPAADEDFLADVRREATHQIRRLAHHPSLVIWCGNNEMEWGAWDWGYEKGVAHPDYAIFHLELPRLLNVEDPARFYQPSSPFSPDHRPPNEDCSGDQHPWSIGFGDNDFRKFRNMTCRFPNEGGILGPTSLPTLRTSLAGSVEKTGGFAWELHDSALSAWSGIPPYSPDKMLADWLGRSLHDMSLEDYVYWAGVLQGAGLAEYIKNFRRRMFNSAAAVFWMLNDVWPCTRSWTILDYQGRRTPAFWPVRRAFAPLIVVVTREDDFVRIYGVNDGAERDAELRYGIMNLEGAYPFDESLPVTLAANSSTLLVEFSAALWDQLGVESHVAFAIVSECGYELSRDTLILPLYREMTWPAAEVNVEWADGTARFSSATFAWRVCLDLDGDQPLPDNFFDIYPGIPTVLQWPESMGRPAILQTGNVPTGE